jgi:hypothetical protein
MPNALEEVEKLERKNDIVGLGLTRVNSANQ